MICLKQIKIYFLENINCQDISIVSLVSFLIYLFQKIKSLTLNYKRKKLSKF